MTEYTRVKRFAFNIDKDDNGKREYKRGLELDSEQMQEHLEDLNNMRRYHLYWYWMQRAEDCIRSISHGSVVE